MLEGCECGGGGSRPGAIVYARRGNIERGIDVRLEEVEHSCLNRSICRMEEWRVSGESYKICGVDKIAPPRVEAFGSQGSRVRVSSFLRFLMPFRFGEVSPS